jgi:ATP/maltotriose-dependent transcriptional regulator MalT
MIKHHAFFEALGDLDDKTPEWSSVFAGLSVLRLIDRLAELRESNQFLDRHSLDASHRVIEKVSTGDPSRAILFRLLEQIARNETGRPVGEDMLAYGRALDLAGKWALACDVFQTIADTFSARTEPELVIEASALLGAASRSTGDWTTSERSYTRSEHLAESIGDRAGVLRARLGMANSDHVRGNLPAADAALEAISTEAEELNFESIRARALHSRASVAHSMGECQRAIHLAYRSLELTTEAHRRERLIADIAAAYSDLGMRDVARNGYLIVAITSPHQWVRWQATVNLMELAAQDGDEKSFDNYLAQLESAALDPRLKTYFLFYRAMGFRRFGRGNADAMFEEARTFAEKNRLHQVAFEIEEATSKPVQPRVIEADDELMEIAEVFEHLRDSASPSLSGKTVSAEQ